MPEPDPQNSSEPNPENQPESGEPESGDTGELTKEEQLARYEEALKNEDWGHQPC